MNDADCIAFLQWALPRLRMRWPGFRKVRKQVCKRLSRRMRELGIPGEGEYRRYLEEHPDEWGTVDGLCRITISRFFRDRGVMLLLQRQVLPELAEGALGKGQGALRCWSAGCGSGEEPYTLSLLWRLEPFEEPAEPLALRFPGLSFQVTATDTEPKVLERARQAVYPRGALKELPAPWVQAAFEETASGLSLRPPFREGVEYSLGDVRDVADPRRYHLILCRNLAFTYYEEGLQGEILARLLPSVEPGGYLVLGGHECLPTGSWPLEQKHAGSPVYRKEEGSDKERRWSMARSRAQIPPFSTRRPSHDALPDR